MTVAQSQAKRPWFTVTTSLGCLEHPGRVTRREEAGDGAGWGLTLEPLTPIRQHSCLWPSLFQPQVPLCPFCPQFRNPKASLRVRLCDLLGHLQRSTERDCQEFYRALYIHAQPLHSRLPSRHSLRKCLTLQAPASPCSAPR